MVKGVRKTKAELEAGNKFGNLTVVGDTGKRDKNGNVILLAKDENSNYKEVLSGNLFNKPEAYSGWNEERVKSIIPNAKRASKSAIQKFSFSGTKANVLKDGLTNNSQSGYIGITFEKQSSKWRVRFVFKGEPYSYFFEEFTDAVTFRNQKTMELFNPILNEAKLPLIKKVDFESIVKNRYVLEKEKIISNNKNKNKKNPSVYVYFDKNRNKFRTYVNLTNGQKKYLGSFTNEQQAIEAEEKYYKQLMEENNNDI